MKHTDFYDTFKSIRHHIIDEIKAAVKAHGGKYSWEDADEYPIVAANPDCAEPEPLDVCVESVCIDDYGDLEIVATSKQTGEDIFYLTINDVFVEHLGYILDYMKETPEVSDVSIPFDD